MSVSGISSTSLYNTQSTQNNLEQAQQEFQKLGQDLQSGNLSAAQADFATLQQLVPQNSSSSQSNSPIAKAFSQLAQDLQSGNLSAAQQDYATIQQDFQKQATQNQTSATEGHHHHHHGGGSGSSEISQLLDQLGTALQSGNLSSAQSAFATLQQELTQNTGQTSSQSSSNSVSVTA
jgi:outer membrane protein assembly factor BamD (BamD/ComL family)